MRRFDRGMIMPFSFISIFKWMLKPVSIWNILLYFFVFIILFILAVLAWLIFKHRAVIKKDIIIFLEKSNRFRIVYDDLRGKEKYKNGNSEYYIKEPNLNSKGRALAVWSDNKPEPMLLSYNKNEWMASDTLTAAINNEIIKKLIQTKNKALDTLMLIGSIGGIVAALCSAITLLISLGIIKPR